MLTIHTRSHNVMARDIRDPSGAVKTVYEFKSMALIDVGDYVLIETSYLPDPFKVRIVRKHRLKEYNGYRWYMYTAESKPPVKKFRVYNLTGKINKLKNSLGGEK